MKKKNILVILMISIILATTLSSLTTGAGIKQQPVAQDGSIEVEVWGGLFNQYSDEVYGSIVTVECPNGTIYEKEVYYIGFKWYAGFEGLSSPGIYTVSVTPAEEGFHGETKTVILGILDSWKWIYLHIYKNLDSSQSSQSESLGI